MITLSALLMNNGLPNQPIRLIEPHRNHAGIWRIKFCYDDLEPLSMNADQASELAVGLHQMAEDEMASEIDEAVVRAKRYGAM
jgi:predicted DNA-binding transcriptional regulator YafY